MNEANPTTRPAAQAAVGRVTGIGGVFFKSKDPGKLKAWYAKHLGLDTDEWGTNFEWRQADDPSRKGFTQWSPFPLSSRKFPPGQDFMINYRVANLAALLEQFRGEGVELLGSVQDEPYGRFCHVRDGEGNVIELWEPNDVEYDKVVEGRTK